jgi:predicted methyltransferase
VTFSAPAQDRGVSRELNNEEGMIMKVRGMGLLAITLLTLSGFCAASSDGALQDIESAIAAAQRSDADKAQDAGRKAAEVLAFVGVRKGMTVLDLIAAGGWYTEVLAAAVGPTGKVYAQNPDAVLKMRDGANDKALTARLADGRLPNVTRLDRPVQELGLAAGSLDVVFTSMNWHDIYNNDPAAAAATLLVLKDLLRPGGVVGIVDHNGSAGADNKALHRIEKSIVVEQARTAGFTVTESPVLANPADDHTKGPFDPSLRGNTDRFVLKLTRP